MKFCHLCVAGTLLSLRAFILGGDASARELTFEDRVKAQEAIDRVYYSHQIGTTKAFEEVEPRDVIEQKVRTYLRQSVALEEFWQTPLSGDALRIETERMARESRLPGRLRELYAALGDDPFLIQECLARPALADRLARNFLTRDERIQGSRRNQIEDLQQRAKRGELDPWSEELHRRVFELDATESGVAGGTSQRGVKRRPMDPGASRFELTPEELRRWRARFPARTGEMSPVLEEPDAFSMQAILVEDTGRVLVARYAVPKVTWDDWWAQSAGRFDENRVLAVASESDALRMPGEDPDSGRDPGDLTATEVPPDSLTTGECLINTWVNEGLGDFLDPRTGHSAVWTGQYMIIWGGGSGFNTGSRYDPATDTWSPTTTENAPSGRAGHSAVWTGSRMIVWGGSNFAGYESGRKGGLYNPVSNTWESMSTYEPPEGRTGHTAVWTGSLMLIWGGSNGTFSNPLFPRSGGRYDPVTDHWESLPLNGAPVGRTSQTTVWTGTHMVVWGGQRSSPPNYYLERLDSGAAYDPVANVWEFATPISSVVGARTGHTAVWDGSRMIVWGGVALNGEILNSGASWDPHDGLWRPISTDNAPTWRTGHSAVWTGSRMIIWGGGFFQFLKSGGRYDPSSDSWSPMSEVNAPAGRATHTAVWTGSLMIVWGGHDGTLRNSGGRYDPLTDTWTPTPRMNVPTERFRHTAVWTGNVMVVWGGSGASGLPATNSGGKYDPVLHTWSATSTVDAPSERYLHTAVWTGEAMVVWGGSAPTGSSTPGYLSTGGRYNPVTDSWTQTSVINAPAGREAHTAVWTGDRIIVWGGKDSNANRNTGGQYDPVADTWTATQTSSAPLGRTGHSAVWTGTRMVVWGGSAPSDFSGELQNSGGQYDPRLNIWIPTSKFSAPSPRIEHTAIWTGSRMVVWGGIGNSGAQQTGGQYDPVSDFWSPVSNVNAPTARTQHTAIWTGRSMIVWGGTKGDFIQYFNSGASYDPGANAWTTLSSIGAPNARSRHTAVWTGTSMLVWGGGDGFRLFTTGAEYFPGCQRPISIIRAATMVECASPAGSPVFLDGTSSTDPDSSPGTNDDIVLFRWFLDFGHPNQTLLGVGSTLTATLPLGSSQVTLQVIDTDGNEGTSTLMISVLDQTLPTIDCSAEQTLECDSPAGAFARVLADAADSCSPTVVLTNTRAGGADASGVYPLGMTQVIFLAEDASGNVADCTVAINVQDTAPPVLDCPRIKIAECDSPAGATVQIAASATDVCSPGEVDVRNDRTSNGADASGDYGFGTTVVGFVATDGSSNVASCVSDVTVRDTTPPHITTVLSPATLWPPNHRLVDVAASVSVSDACSTPVIALASITSSEPDDAPGAGDGNTTDDIQGGDPGTADFSYRVRAERDGTASGRIYEVDYLTVDGSGNAAHGRAFLFVPHDVEGVSDPLDLSVRQDVGGTMLSWNPVLGATSYNTIRGRVASLRDGGSFIDLGNVTCIQAGSPETATSGHEDADSPPVGEAFFYLVEYDDSGYGSTTVAKPRVETAGGCN